MRKCRIAATRYVKSAIEKLHRHFAVPHRRAGGQAFGGIDDGVGVEAVVALSRALIPPMAERGRGAVLFVSSMAGNQPMPHFGAYAATKAAVTSLAEALHCELKHRHISVTALCPGGVTTEFSAVGGMEHVEKRTPSAIMIGPQACARAGLKALDSGKRVEMPGLAVKALAWFGAHAPRALWLPLCKKMMT